MEPLKSNLRISQASSELKKRDYINTSLSSEPKYGVLFSDFITTLINKRVRITESTRANYRTIIHNINLFCEEYNAILFTNSIGEEFLDDFILFLESRGLKQGYISLTIQVIHSLVNKAHKMGYAIDLSYKEVSVDNEDAENVYLSMNEITRLYYLKGLTKFQCKIKDLFVLGCLTGLRFSDFTTLTKDNFSGGYITKIAQKTKTRVVIPIHDYVLEIYDKYEVIPYGYSNQYFNRAIKDICRMAEFNEEVVLRYTRGGKHITETKPKWQMVSSHTARRSAATNMYLTGRMKTYEIMSITGHKTESSFFRYIKVTRDDISKQISSDIYFRK